MNEERQTPDGASEPAPAGTTGVSAKAGHLYGPIRHDARYRFLLENFQSGTGHFLWLPDLQRLALVAERLTEDVVDGQDLTPPAEKVLETFPALKVDGDLYLVDLPTPGHLDNPAFTGLEELRDLGPDE